MKSKGFTLVEIAIVLVIIGLLLGGILKGQEMITQAKIKNIMADYSGISAAYHGYQDRYRAIPGDDPGAATRWATAPAAFSGDGNGQLGGTYANTCPNPLIATSPETCDFWDHLRRAGFVSGSGGAQPFNAVTGMIGVQTGNGAGGTALGGFSGLIMCSANLPDKIAIAVDTQMDDGVPNSGSVRGVLQTAPNPAIDAGATAATGYAETGTNTYTLCRSL
ncbi:MAG TPA: prepilin-type N-terminal cleavage/methylation domain-containing protein [Burkholderiales bacterium]|nr:prepilin-type N-terminal cleavage/methylation domain-containing protein [Burkholderiales bacterium]